MANPTEIDEYKPVVIEVTSTESSITLDVDRQYTCAHDGETTAGVADTNTIYLSTSASITATPASGDDKAKLLGASGGGRALVIGPNVATLYFVTASGSPTMTISPSKPMLREW